MEAFFAFCTKVRAGTVTSAPSGLTPVLALAIWYDQYRSGQAESYGIMSIVEAEKKLTVERFMPVYEAFTSGVALLGSASPTPPIPSAAKRPTRASVMRSSYR
jgi:hypothetical protein